MATTKNKEVGMDEAAIVAYIDAQLETIKGDYRSDIEPWEAYKERTTLQCIKAFHDQVDGLAAGFQVLQESDKFTREEKLLLREKFRNYHSRVVEKLAGVAETPPCEEYGIDPALLVKGYDVGMGLLEQGQHEKAKNVFFLLAFLDPSVYQYWLGLGMAYAMSGDHPDAIVLYNVALPISSKACYVVMLWIIDSLIALKANNEARTLLEVIIEGTADDPEPESRDARARAQKKLAALPPQPA